MNNMKEVASMDKIKEVIAKVEQALEGGEGGKVVLAQKSDWKTQRLIYDELSRELEAHPDFLFSRWGVEEVAQWFLARNGRVAVLSFRIIFGQMVYVEIGRIAEWNMEYFLRELENLTDDILPIEVMKANQQKIKEVIQTWRACKT